MHFLSTLTIVAMKYFKKTERVFPVELFFQPSQHKYLAYLQLQHLLHKNHTFVCLSTSFNELVQPKCESLSLNITFC